MIFIDTSILYALLVRSERRHDAALKATRSVWNRSLLTTSYVLVETVALLQHRIGLSAVWDLEDRVRPVLEVAWVDAEIYQRAMERLRREGRRGLSLVDCVSFEVMRSRGIREALTLDAHFADAGFRVLPRG